MSPAAPASPSLSAGPRPLQLVDGNVQTTSSCPSPTASGLSTPPPSANRRNPRRQSSIAYYPSDHSPTWELRSPTTPSGSFLKRSSSFNQNQHTSERLALRRDRRSLPASGVLADAQAQAERPPLTLTEKHADLLHFIAQKESKCLELRSQLAAHEAELAQLKRKWERIVSRGMDRAYSQPPQSASASSSLLSGAVKDGVQGVGRLLADLSSNPSASPSASPRPPMLALRTNSSRVQGHTNTQSISSVSTSLTGSSVRLSQSSASSLAFDDDAEGPAVDYKRTSISVDGGTGIESPVEISPASAIKAAKLHRRKSREAPPSPSLVPMSPSPAPPSGASGRGSQQEDYKKTIKRSSLHISSNGSSIPPAASIPGLGPLASPLASAWMGSVGSSVGKKWEELQKGETFAKGQKRASLLISDVSSSIFAALASPSSASSAAAAAPSSVSISSNPFAATLSPLSTSPAPSAQSLLEDDDAGEGLGSVLVPDTKAPAPLLKPTSAPASATKQGKNHEQSRSLLDDDDEWNW